MLRHHDSICMCTRRPWCQDSWKGDMFALVPLLPNQCPRVWHASIGLPHALPHLGSRQVSLRASRAQTSHIANMTYFTTSGKKHGKTTPVARREREREKCFTSFAQPQVWWMCQGMRTLTNWWMRQSDLSAGNGAKLPLNNQAHKGTRPQQISKCAVACLKWLQCEQLCCRKTDHWLFKVFPGRR